MNFSLSIPLIVYATLKKHSRYPYHSKKSKWNNKLRYSLS